MSWLILKPEDLDKTPLLFPFLWRRHSLWDYSSKIPRLRPVTGGRDHLRNWHFIISLNKAVLWLVCLFNLGFFGFIGWQFATRLNLSVLPDLYKEAKNFGEIAM